MSEYTSIGRLLYEDLMRAARAPRGSTGYSAYDPIMLIRLFNGDAPGDSYIPLLKHLFRVGPADPLSLGIVGPFSSTSVDLKCLSAAERKPCAEGAIRDCGVVVRNSAFPQLLSQKARPIKLDTRSDHRRRQSPSAARSCDRARRSSANTVSFAPLKSTSKKPDAGGL